MTSRRPRRHPGTLERAVIAAVRKADWIVESDLAAVWLLRYVAEDLDTTRRQSTLDGTISYDPEKIANGRQLLGALGLTAESRYRLGLWEVDVDDDLAEILRIADSPDRDSAES